MHPYTWKYYCSIFLLIFFILQWSPPMTARSDHNCCLHERCQRPVCQPLVTSCHLMHTHSITSDQLRLNENRSESDYDIIPLQSLASEPAVHGPWESGAQTAMTTEERTAGGGPHWTCFATLCRHCTHCACWSSKSLLACFLQVQSCLRVTGHGTILIFEIIIPRGWWYVWDLNQNLVTEFLLIS
jgi:hypothetical protein